jgi:hypothetical protein
MVCLSGSRTASAVRCSCAKKISRALSPLRDSRFFEQVFLDQGAVAWLGEIDLAPDAMYEQVARQRTGAGRSR